MDSMEAYDNEGMTNFFAIPSYMVYVRCYYSLYVITSKLSTLRSAMP